MKLEIAATLFCFSILTQTGFARAENPLPVCEPNVMLKGEPSVIAAIENTLSTNGISTAPNGNCPNTEVTVTTLEGYFVITIEEPNGKQVVRNVVGHESAASIIESWVRSDLSAHMLSPPTTEKPASTTDRQLPPLGTDESAVAEPDPERASAWLDLGLEAGIGFDGSTWFGGTLSGCVLLGPTCIGAMAGFDVDPSLTGDSDLLETNRMMLSLMAVADCAIFFESFTLRPGIEIGAAFLRSTKTYTNYDVDNQDNGDNDNQTGDNQDSEEVLVKDDQWNFSVGAHLIGALKLNHGFSLLVAISAYVFPLADTDSIEEEHTKLAGSPRGLARLRFGLEYGF